MEGFLRAKDLMVSTGLTVADFPGCLILDHYIFKDPISGYNIFYPLTAYGGPLSGNPMPTFTSSTSGGAFDKDCYQDYCYDIVGFEPIKIFCVTTINFVMSAVDQSLSRISKFVFNFDDGSEPLIITKKLISNNQELSAKIISRTYYPVNREVTVYKPSVQVVYDNCCINTFNYTLCSFQCGIIEKFEDVYLLNAQQTEKSTNVLVTLENIRERVLFHNVIKTDVPFYAIPLNNYLPNLIEPVPPAVNIPVAIPTTVIPPVTTQPIDLNPIVIPKKTYVYISGLGIILQPSPTNALEFDTDLLTGAGDIYIEGTVPYAALTGINIEVQEP